ncbi:MAG: hypothetical protein WBD34_23100 [Burkholderiaceae bacterium]
MLIRLVAYRLVACFASAALSVVLTTIGLLGATSVAVAKSPITIASGDALRDQINARILVDVLQRSGLKATSLRIAADAAADALTAGTVHILPEVSPAKVKAEFADALLAGRVVDLGFKQAGPNDPKYRKLAWSKTRRLWPGEFKLIKNMTIPEADVLAMVRAAKNGQPVETVVATWANQNTSRWGKWKSASKNWMKP